MVIFKTTIPLNKIESAVIESSKEHFMNASRIIGIDDVIVNICGSEYDGCKFVYPNIIVCSIYRLRDDLRRDIYYAPYHEFGHIYLSKMKIPQKLGNNSPHEIPKHEFVKYYPKMIDCPDDIYISSINDIASILPEYLADIVMNRNDDVNKYYIDWIKQSNMYIIVPDVNERKTFTNICKIIANNLILKEIDSDYIISNKINGDITHTIENILSDASNDITPTNIIKCMSDIYSTYIDFLSKLG